MPGTDVGSGEIHAMSHMLGCRIGVFSPPLKISKGDGGGTQIACTMRMLLQYCFTMKGIAISSLC